MPPSDPPTPEAVAAQLLHGISSIALKVTWKIIPSGPMRDAVDVPDYIPVLRDRIAAALAAAEARGRAEGLDAGRQIAEKHFDICHQNMEGANGDEFEALQHCGYVCRQIAAAIARLKEDAR